MMLNRYWLTIPTSGVKGEPVTIANPGFDTNGRFGYPPDGWEGTGTTYTNYSDPVSPPNVVNLPDAGDYIRQTVTVTPRARYRLSVHAKCWSTGQDVRVKVEILDNGGTSLAETERNVGSSWETLETEFESDAPQVTIRISNTTVNTQFPVIDSVSIEPQ